MLISGTIYPALEACDAEELLRTSTGAEMKYPSSEKKWI
jgi:hypothetical protein